ncbi:RhoGAP domain containing protein [Trichomonas vaginalis G3]|uniref:RhoGAP domain containing protein n=1 Tax=Trichomonas vaginalis (strain ATCC PRA-98 / G3) TaxID=412133 RepID=A2EYD2_TRIV3|nr:GTPase activator protein [Trichomonas vaginalis G3]EAY02359.1 RhoGAP domain containing protein [Trichomonas vaginalis G3]KAI5514029.1 GTPase activator protein [Trichomonas vaginalis G3]|eukprot:XP_001330626.1 RhoGAP domain containing protein [Trichomonas vaginalis G3]
MTSSYYQYTTDDNQYYYYKIDDGSTTFDFPYESTIYDPDTSTLVYAPGNPVPPYAKRGGRPFNVEPIKTAQAEAPSNNEVDPKVFNSVGNPTSHAGRSEHRTGRGRKHSKLHINVPPPEQPDSALTPPSKAKARSISLQPEVKQKQAPQIRVDVFNKEAILDEITKFHRIDEASKVVKYRKIGFLFSRRPITTEEIIRFQNTPITGPLLNEIPKEMKKEPLKCFEAILQYIGLKKSNVNPSDNLQFLISTAYKSELLRDEIYFQIVKQTFENPNDECNKKTWQLLLLFTSLFTSNPNLSKYISGHLASSMTSNDLPEQCRPFAELSYLRYKSRMLIGKCAKDPGSIGYIDIMNDPFKSSSCFACSIQECLWVQRNIKKGPNFPTTRRCLYAPKAQIPIILHLMAEQIIAKGAKNMEGIFRVPGSGAVIEESIDRVNVDADCIKSMRLHDLCSFFKRWFASLPKKIIDDTKFQPFLDMIRSEQGKKEVEPVLNLLDPSDRICLLYLAGFLRELSEAQGKTQMGPSNLALVFSPNMFNMPPDMKMAKDLQVEVQGFIIRLINEADVSNIYPYKEE